MTRPEAGTALCTEDAQSTELPYYTSLSDCNMETSYQVKIAAIFHTVPKRYTISDTGPTMESKISFRIFCCKSKSQ